MSAAEKAVHSTSWREFKIWDGRSYYYNETTKCSVWVTPPEVLIAQKNAVFDSDPIDPDWEEYQSFDRRNKTNADCRSEFYALLVEKGVNESHTYIEAVSLIKDDMRFHALPTPQSKQIFFASYISNLIKAQVHAERDQKQALLKMAVVDFQNWSGMSESTTHVQMEKDFHGKEWFKKLDRADVRQIFHLFSQDFMEVEKLQKQKLQDSMMQELKETLLSNSEIAFSSHDVVENIYASYNKLQPACWTTLSDSQKLVVIKSCLNQRIKEMKLAVINSNPLPLTKRKERKEKDRIRLIIAEYVRSHHGSAESVVTRGQSLSIPKWDGTLEHFLKGKKLDGKALTLAKSVFEDYTSDMKTGKDPLEGIVV